jgi:hypothetical protein
MSLSQQRSKKRKPSIQHGSSSNIKRRKPPPASTLTVGVSQEVKKVSLGLYKIPVRTPDAYCDITNLALQVKKRLKDFNQLASTKAFMVALKHSLPREDQKVSIVSCMITAQ